MKSFKQLIRNIQEKEEEETSKQESAWKIAFDVFSEQDERYKGFFIVFEESQDEAIKAGTKILEGMYPEHQHDITLSRVKNLSERDYKREYANYHSRPDQIERRSARNSARRIIKKKVKTEEDIEGKDVHHKDNNPLNNDKKNLSIVTQRYNRREPRLRERKLKKEQEEE
jgi:hypothetical protein